MTTHLSPQRLRSYIEEKELPSRSPAWSSIDGLNIIRYGSFVGSVIERHTMLSRTMMHARAHIDQCERLGTSVANGTVMLAETLTGSKGRFTRNWHAPTGGLWGSLIYISTLLPRYRLLVPLAVGVACCEAVRAQGASGAVIRWINDVLIDGYKVGGFLSESFTGETSKEDYCLLGFGININNSAFPEELRGVATSLKRQLGRTVDLEEFTCCFLAKLCWNIGLLYHQEAKELEAGPGFEYDGEHPLIARWRELSDSIGRPVMFGFDVVEKPQYRATVAGITNDGGLRLMLENGTEIVEYSGEIRYVRSV